MLPVQVRDEGSILWMSSGVGFSLGWNPTSDWVLFGVCLIVHNLRGIKSRNITLPTKVHLVKAMVFPVVMYGWGSWTIKKGECQIVDTFELC